MHLKLSPAGGNASHDKQTNATILNAPEVRKQQRFEFVFYEVLFSLVILNQENNEVSNADPDGQANDTGLFLFAGPPRSTGICLPNVN